MELSVLISVLLSLLSFIGMSLIYFIKLLFKKLENLESYVNDLRTDIEILKNTK